MISEDKAYVFCTIETHTGYKTTFDTIIAKDEDVDVNLAEGSYLYRFVHPTEKHTILVPLYEQDIQEVAASCRTMVKDHQPELHKYKIVVFYGKHRGVAMIQ